MNNMIDGKSLSAMIRGKKKGALRPDMDYAGQDAVDPNEAWDMKQAHEVNEALEMPDHEPASAEEMGSGESSQDVHSLKRQMHRIEGYLKQLMLRE
jgi:hypothetical protein